MQIERQGARLFKLLRRWFGDVGLQKPARARRDARRRATPWLRANPQLGFVYSKKGKGGGYMLARPAHEIMVGHVVRVLDGPLAPIPCASRGAYRRCVDCADEERCSVRLMMLDVGNAIAEVLDKRSLAEMRALSDIDELALMFHI